MLMVLYELLNSLPVCCCIPLHFKDLIDAVYEGNIYEISRFGLVSPRTALRPVEAKFTMILGSIVILKRDIRNVDSFPYWAYCLTNFASLPSADETPERFVDVIGKITSVSDVAVFELLGRTQPLKKRNIFLSDRNDQTVKVVLWGNSAVEFNGSTVRALGQSEPAIAIFVGTTVRDYSGQRGLAGGKACRWYINEDIPEINVSRASVIDRVVEPIALAQLDNTTTLRVQDGSYPTKSIVQLVNFNLFENEDAHFRCSARVTAFGPSHQWFHAVCSICGSLAKPDTSFPLHDLYICTAPACVSKKAYLRYRIAVIVLDQV